jgi:altronate hydrolase
MRCSEIQISIQFAKPKRPAALDRRSVKPNALLIDPQDDVVTVLEAVAEGELVRWASGDPIPAREEIPVGHKVAIRAISQGAPIQKYGWPIGAARVPIVPGDCVHTHNLSAVEG